MASESSLRRAGRAGTIKSHMADLTIGTLHRIRFAVKKSSDLGFTMVGGVDYAFGGLYVDSVSGSMKTGKSGLKVGDRLISVNNNGMLGLTKPEGDALLKTITSEYAILVLRLGPHQWRSLKARAAGKAQMSTPGPFFKPHIRAANLPLMDGVHSTHGVIKHVTLTTQKGVALGLRMQCFAKDGAVSDTKTTGCLFITEINSSGLAVQAPAISVGCRLLEINGHCLLSSSQVFFARKVKDCYDNNAPIKLVVQNLDAAQWNALFAALSKDKSSPVPPVSKAAQLAQELSRHSTPTSAQRQSSGEPMSLSVREKELLLGPPSKSLHRTPSMEQKRQLLNKQRHGGTGPVVSQSGGDTGTLTRSRPSAQDKLALLNAQRDMALAANLENLPAPPAGLLDEEEDDDTAAEVMEELGSDFGISGEKDDAEEIFGFDKSDINTEASPTPDIAAEEEAVDEDEDGNPFLDPSEEEINGFGNEDFSTPAALKLAPFDEQKYLDIPQRLPPVSILPPGVHQLNRYINILPTPRTRVKLQMVANDPTSTYINANFISSWDLRNPKAYICCQAPTPTPRTVFDFWRMVWDNKSKVIIMATGITEGGVQKCVRYWPTVIFNPETAQGSVTYGNIIVRVMDGFRKDGYITSKLLVQRQGEAPREIRHYWFDSWPDHGVPQRTEPLKKLIDAARSFDGNYDSPWVIHCSAGIGRTGTVVAVDWGLHMLDNKGSADVVDIVDKLRNFRGGLVQHPEQAEFVQLCLSRYIESHGNTMMLSVIEEDILEASIEKALQFVPEEMGVHHSQVDGDEGSEEQIPRWRLQQMQKVKTFQQESITEEIDELLEEGAVTVAERRGRREKNKQEKADKAKADAERKMNDLLSLPAEDAFASLTRKSTVAHNKRRSQIVARSIKNRRVSRVINQFQSGNARHGSILMGKMNRSQYATLDGDFHLDSNFAGDLDK